MNRPRRLQSGPYNLRTSSAPVHYLIVQALGAPVRRDPQDVRRKQRKGIAPTSTKIIPARSTHNRNITSSPSKSFLPSEYSNVPNKISYGALGCAQQPRGQTHGYQGVYQVVLKWRGRMAILPNNPVSDLDPPPPYITASFSTPGKGAEPGRRRSYLHS